MKYIVHVALQHCGITCTGILDEYQLHVFYVVLKKVVKELSIVILLMLYMYVHALVWFL